jgi:hypothetical protein
MEFMGKAQAASKPSIRVAAVHELSQQQTAAYVADMSLGLRSMSEKAGLSFLTYLLDMAVQEAMQQSEVHRRRRTDKP